MGSPRRALFLTRRMQSLSATSMTPPWESLAQERWGNSPSGQKALGKKGVAEWNSATKGKKLPKRVKKKKSK